MGPLNVMMERYFIKEDQQTIFYPWGWMGFYGRGRILVNIEQEISFRKFTKRYVLFSSVMGLAAILAGGLLGETYWNFQEPFDGLEDTAGVLLAGFVLSCVLSLIWIYILRINGIYKLKTTNKRLSFFQNSIKVAPYYGRPALIFFSVLFFIMLMAGFVLLLKDFASGNWVDIVVAVLTLGLFGFMFFLSISMLSSIKEDKK